MEQRYIQRFRLPERLYTAGAPVVLVAGALLEDTHFPRLVLQLKFKSISPQPIAALTVAVDCRDADRNTVGTRQFHYRALHIARGQTFGQYTALILPVGETAAVTVRVEHAAFEDGTGWTAPEGAQWTGLPSFLPLEDAVKEPELLALSRKGLPGGRYAFFARPGLWYCTCGGVNQEGETTCHRCGRLQEQVAAYGEAARLAARYQAEREEANRLAAEREQARQAAQERAAARKAAAREKAAQWKTRLHRRSGKTGPQGAGPGSGRKRSLLIGGIGAAAALAFLLTILLPKLLDGNSAASGPLGILEAAEPETTLQVTTPTDGERIPVRMYADENGVCKVTPELVRESVPRVECINFFGVPNMGNEIDPYLLDSFQMASLVASKGEWGSGNEWGSFSPKNDPDSPQCLLLFDRNTHLMGYAVGVPEEVGDGSWQMEVTLCDYDFSALYEEQLAAFTQAREQTFGHYIAPKDLTDSGAVWFLSGYNTGRGPLLREDDSQAYHLWSQMTSPYFEKHCREIGQIEHRLPREDRWRCFLLFDGDHELIGYTMLDSTGGGGSVSVPELENLGTVDLYIQEDENGQCLFTEDWLREQVPETAFFNLDMSVDLGNAIDAYLADSFHMAWLVSSGGEEQGGYRTASYNLQYENLIVLMLYSDLTRLCGYYIGIPEETQTGLWHIPLTLCDYDFMHVYEEQAAGYDAAPQLTYIPQEKLADCGAAWYIPPINQTTDNGGERSVALQSLWSRATSPYIREFARSIEGLVNNAGNASPEHPYCCFLLDADRRHLGYTVITDGSLVKELSAPTDRGETGSRTVQLDVTADENQSCTLTLEQVQTLIPETERMEFGGAPNLGELDHYLEISDQVAWWVASDGTREINQTSGRFSVQDGRVPSRMLLLYRDTSTLCGYFVGKPEQVGEDTWRMEITLCDYDFSELCQRQAQAFAQREPLPELTLEEGIAQGAEYLMDAYYLNNNDAFCQTVQQYGLWSRARLTRAERFYKELDDVEELRPNGRSEGGNHMGLLPAAGRRG